uniref:tRNA N(3)-methylcytidine methyltransferase METTL2-like isoform X1 n=2 Tax=Styela clava TaxID=7725 RepID=UPI001939A624|nr:tRNA N(3)-methylcytidine methyltransferase METTL2-like isoform X1 [Styela clava]
MKPNKMADKNVESATPQEKRSQFGTRYLNSDSDVFQHNAWDDVEWSENQEEEARGVVEKQILGKLSDKEGEEIVKDASSKWNKFYEKHDNRFFKDRHWLFTEFPELLKRDAIPSDTQKCVEKFNKLTITTFPGCKSSRRFLEIGCGAGNTVFPVLRTNNDSDLFMYACDYSSTAVEIVKSNPLYDENRCYAFVHDISSDNSYPMPEESLDAIIMIFVLSALPWDKMGAAVKKLSALLKPGGVILFRDYGRYDMAQLRFKSNRCLGDNFYSRGDGTLVYFFTKNEVRTLFTDAGLIEEQNLVDRRLQVNRARQIKMYRVWNQAKFRKPS